MSSFEKQFEWDEIGIEGESYIDYISVEIGYSYRKEEVDCPAEVDVDSVNILEWELDGEEVLLSPAQISEILMGLEEQIAAACFKNEETLGVRDYG